MSSGELPQAESNSDRHCFQITLTVPIRNTCGCIKNRARVCVCADEEGGAASKDRER